MARDCGYCAHPRTEHGRECDLYETDSRREVCLLCPGYEEPGYPRGTAWHRWTQPVQEGQNE